MAEAYARSNAVEHGLRTRATIVDMRGQLNIRQGEEASAEMRHYPRWNETSAMRADCLTNTMTSGRLNEMMSTGIFDMRLTEENLAIKAKHREWRASRKCRNGRRIPTLELLMLAMFGESDVVLVKLPST